MNRDNLINTLSKEHTSFSPIISEKNYLKLYILFAIGFILTNILYIDVRRDDDLSSTYFIIESMLWISLTLSSTILSYRLLSPGKKTRPLKVILLGSCIGLILSLILRTPLDQFSQNLISESNYHNGACGAIISLSGLLFFGAFLSKIKKGYFQSRKLILFSLTCSFASVGTLAMQYICEHEAAIHVYLWHIPPYFLLSGLIYYKTRKL